MSYFGDYLLLVERLGIGGINRSENDLSSNLKNALSSFGLHGVIDTGSGSNRAKRPDIALYVDPDAADIGSAADIVIESKKPAELSQYATLIDALTDDGLWYDKFVPYVTAHAERITYFILTTFDRFLIVTINTALRAEISKAGAFAGHASRRHALRTAETFELQDDVGVQNFSAWCDGHLRPESLSPPPLSSISDVRFVDDASTLESFASDLADIVVGPEGRNTSSGTLVHTIRAGGTRLDELAPDVQRALIIYAMAANVGISVDSAQDYIATHWKSEWSEFVSASVHSLIGRLFAIKAIEDCFCIDTDPPLIPRADWVFHTDQFDLLDLEDLSVRFFSAMAGLSQVENTAVKDLAATGRFYDWLAPQLDAAAFRRLLALFFSYSFNRLDEDLLGRFFEIYAQRVDRRRRKQLGQYYTPLPIVRQMWRLAMNIVRERDVLQDVFVLDPGVGSGTFLIEGANQLYEAGLAEFWDRLTGFDISPQAIGIAQINVYLAVLAHLDRQEAETVGNLQLYPTDALDPRNGARLRAIMPLLADESTKAFVLNRIDLSETVKQQSRFSLVIGNPHTAIIPIKRLPRSLTAFRSCYGRLRPTRERGSETFATITHGFLPLPITMSLSAA